MTNFSLPTTSRHYDDEILTDIKDRDVSIVERLFTSDTNIPIGTIKFEAWSASTHSGRRVWEYQAGGWVIVAHADAPGTIKMLGTATIPTGWLLCNGDAVSRSTYSDLFAEISTTFGVGNGSTTFNLPDLRQRFPIGKAVSGTGSTLGGTGGAITHTHTGASHQHTLAHSHTVQGHYHSTGQGGTLTVYGQGITTSCKIYGSTTRASSTHVHGTSVSEHVHGQTVTSRQAGGGSCSRDDYDYDNNHEGIIYAQGCTTGATAIPGMSIQTAGAHTHGAGNLTMDFTHTHNTSVVSGSAGTTAGGAVDGNGSQATSQVVSGSISIITGYGTTGGVDPPYMPLNFIIRT